ncbi:MAG: MFS transporter [Anaerolineales bacterium]|nr:MFS transporter [Anaerolineales bacterium]
MTKANDETAEIQQQIEHNYRWNFAVNTLDGASFSFGMSFMAYTVILPLYVSHFTDNPLLIGLIPVLGTAGYLVPQLFTANTIERAPLKKFFPVNIGFFTERLPVLLLPLSAYFLATSHPDMALVSFFLLFAWHTIGAGLIVVGWQDMVAKIFPVDRRGRFFGVSNFLGNGVGILGALLVPFMLERYPFPLGFVFSFSIAATLIFISWIFLSLTREPAVYSTKVPVSQSDYLRSLPAILRRDRNFSLYLLSMFVFWLSGMATGFLVVYAKENWNMSDGEAGGYVIALQVGMALSFLFFGFLSDRKGHKLSLEICLLLGGLSLVLTILAPSPLWFYSIFFLRGAVNAGSFVSGISIVYEFTSPENRPTYIGLANTISGAAGAVAPLMGGWIAAAASYRSMFIFSAIIGAVSWVMLRYAVREPRQQNQERLDVS